MHSRSRYLERAHARNGVLYKLKILPGAMAIVAGARCSVTWAALVVAVPREDLIASLSIDPVQDRGRVLAVRACAINI